MFVYLTAVVGGMLDKATNLPDLRPIARLNNFSRSHPNSYNNAKEKVMTEHAAEQPTQYRFSFADPGMFLEIYVPTTYEPQVREALLKGMDLKEVKNYLRRHWADIRNFLGEHEDLLKEYESKDESVDKLEKNPLEGFSIYQVDGAFGGCDIIEADKVSIVRLLFLPTLGSMDTRSVS